MQGDNLKERYLDLLIRILANTIYEDPDLGGSHCFDLQKRTHGLDWPRRAHTMVGLLRLRSLRDLVQRTLDDGIPGDFIETGVWRGGCCILMKGVLVANGDYQRKIYVADSFEGLPPPKADLYPADSDITLHLFKELAIPVDEVKANFARYDLLDAGVVFVKGFFEDTLPNLNAGPFAVIRLDGDMYESTIVSLVSLYPKLSRGGYVIIDDYGAVEACRQAVHDYRDRERITAEIHGIDGIGAYWRKPESDDS